MGYPVAGTGCGPGVGGFLWTSAGIILVLYILLVIVLRGGLY
ncbi:hypothetical protein FHS18_006523 [Paenibacillus phyllosphaerae]|uniref:Sporulation protein YjcZ n=1 Tax=Paenibacillus phyllosphaerae TaxID=274593 RepID=A0A7W5FRK3_9BACL|nr:sporulation protein YjcZ [Paenibacillus phyllosphaerae]MBB3114402.1 hypothetical protein [Paenibacillus phyllosphaerae]